MLSIPLFEVVVNYLNLKDLTSDDIKKGIDKAIESNYLEGLTITDEAKELFS